MEEKDPLDLGDFETGETENGQEEGFQVNLKLIENNNCLKSMEEKDPLDLGDFETGETQNGQEEEGFQVNLKLIENNNCLKSMEEKDPLGLGDFETGETQNGEEEEGFQVNWDEFNDLIIKEEPIVMEVDIPEIVEIKTEVEESLQGDDFLGFGELIENEERNELENEINSNKYKHCVTKELIVVLEDYLSGKNKRKRKTLKNVNGKTRRKKPLKEDLSLNGQLRVNCRECGKQFRSHANLRGHLRIHKDRKPYQCSECGKYFRQCGEFNNHILIHTGEKPHKCSECGQCFRNRRQLIRHKIVHSNETPFLCSVCGKGFKKRDSFNMHQLIHSGEKSYQCSECGKLFRTKKNLTRHGSVHLPKKYPNKYKCFDCGQYFRCKWDIAPTLHNCPGFKEETK